MWSVNGGTIFLVGYVPVEAIQQEGRTVNQNIAIVVASLMAAFVQIEHHFPALDFGDVQNIVDQAEQMLSGSGNFSGSGSSA